MKLWIIEWDDSPADENSLVIVRAETQEGAVELAKQGMFYYYADWHKYKFDNDKWEIKELTADGPSEIVAQR
jgi:hypothetical protein